MSSTVMLFVQWFHVLAAIILIGGAIFLRTIVTPAARHLADSPRQVIVTHILARFRWVQWTAVVVLFFSGVLNMLDKAFKGLQDPAYIGLLGIKIMLALLVFTIVLLLSLPIKSFAPFQAHRERWLVIAIVFAIMVVGLAAYLRVM